MKAIVAIITASLLCMSCQPGDAGSLPDTSAEIDALYYQVDELIDTTQKMQRDTCELYREHDDVLPPIYCVQKQLPPPPYTIQ